MRKILKWLSAIWSAIRWGSGGDPPKEQTVAWMLNELLEYSNTRMKAQAAMKTARRINESSRAAIVALESLLSDEVTTSRINDLMESAEKIAVKAWSAGELTPPEARHLKERKDDAE